MPLTDVAIRNAKPRDKPYKVGDTLGLFISQTPAKCYGITQCDLPAFIWEHDS